VKIAKVKTRKCAFRKCRKEFIPVRSWQKYHSRVCASAVGNIKTCKILREARKVWKEQQQQRAV